MALALEGLTKNSRERHSSDRVWPNPSIASCRTLGDMNRVKTNQTAASWRKHPWIVVSAAMAANLCLAFRTRICSEKSFDHFRPALGTLSRIILGIYYRALVHSRFDRVSFGASFVIAGSFALTILWGLLLAIILLFVLVLYPRSTL